ncbi:hypothetical protein LZF95_13475 [Algoriphagus sp. AGSA1]|uniref:hypothetical protein n=1 Tax=Algoriphagus sp. AGSA1 TaxID=2907213 RepID=UPI001F281270|nr:hypothetical protein [Algoriphagus sp. AGSA1]MCE7055691.1 hypothetical protein [Algoriphagus sp. AGSA1]
MNRTSILRLASTFLCLYSLFAFNVAHAQSRSSSNTSSSNGYTSRFTSNDNNQKLNIESNGKIAIGSDEKSISSISKGGYLKIEKTTFGNTRSIFISNSNGGLDYEYKEGRSVKPFEPDGRVWLAEILPELLNTTTIGAEDRVERLYAKGGIKSVLDIIGNLHSDHVKTQYLGLLLKKNLKSNEITATIDKTISQVSSDHYQTEIFKKVSPSYFNDVNLLRRAVESLQSDHFKAELLKPIFSANVIKGEGQKSIELIKMIDSDHFKTEIARSIDFEDLSDQDLKFMIDELVGSIDSDHFKNELLKTAINKGNMTEDRSLIVLSGVKDIQSDHFKAEILKYLCQKQGSEKVKAKIRETAKSEIKSTHFFGEVMRCAG